MSIFAHHEGAVGDFLGFLFQLGWRKIAIIVDVTLAPVGVAEGKGDGIQRHNSLAHRLQVRPYPTLVAQAPEDDAGVVLIALN